MLRPGTTGLVLALFLPLGTGCGPGDADGDRAPPGSAALTLPAAVLPDAVAGRPYAQRVPAAGAAPLTYAIERGAPCGWLSIDAHDGTLRGTPPDEGDVTFTVRVTDALGRRASRAFTLHVMERHPTSLPPLAVKGRQVVVRGTEEPVQLRGVAFTSGVWEWDPAHPERGGLEAVRSMQGEADFARVKGWGATAVTLYLNWEWFRTEAGWNWLGRTLDACRRNDLYVIPSLVVYPVGGKRGGPDFWADAGALDAVHLFWVELERRHGADPILAGVDVLNEPQGTDADTVVEFEKELIDAVREVTPERVVFVEPVWGSPQNQRWVDRPGLVYVSHYYEPQTFTNQGWPWAYAGGIPAGAFHYPGPQQGPARAERIDPVGSAPAGTSSWTEVAGALVAPDLGEGQPVRAHFNVHAERSPLGTAWFDDLQYAVSEGGAPPAEADWRDVPNGSFEIANEVSADALYWDPWSRDAGPHVARVSDMHHGGSWAVRLQRCRRWCEVKTTYDGSYQITGGVDVRPGQVLRVRFWARGEALAPDGAGVEVRWTRPTTTRWDRDVLAESVWSQVTWFSAYHDVPALVGELSPSLVAPRPDLSVYAADLLEVLGEQGLGWMFYPYRENWTAQRYLGLYNGPRSAPTSGCVEDTDLVNVVREHLGR